MIKIAISGKKRSGKDTLAKILNDEYGWNFDGFHKNYAIAEPIYEIARDFYGMEEKDGVLLQEIGDKLRSVKDGSGKVHTNVLCEALIRRMKRDEEEHGEGLQTVSDVRLVEEYEALKAAGFLMVRIEADQDSRNGRAGQEENRDESHKTETELDDPNLRWDRVVNNNKKLADLNAEAFTILTMARLAHAERQA